MAREFWYHSTYGEQRIASSHPPSAARSKGESVRGAKAGIAAAVQCTKIPSLASSNHAGSGRVPASIASSPSVSYGRAMEQVGTVAELWRYPVKSMQGERVERLELAPGGAIGDRTLAVVDHAAG